VLELGAAGTEALVAELGHMGRRARRPRLPLPPTPPPSLAGPTELERSSQRSSGGTAESITPEAKLKST